MSINTACLTIRCTIAATQPRLHALHARRATGRRYACWTLAWVCQDGMRSARERISFPAVVRQRLAECTARNMTSVTHLCSSPVRTFANQVLLRMFPYTA